ncbi:hypothetical protein ACFO5R_16800 [Halosolutus amylolyticus]|uniref:DUF2064 domain-containing protein n=1 Tax=Halosolutus amylolyticus TaxID=2932267 RepID=A0ABD5PUH1_9EURY|nr:hypothetical protein [Halosolutus amylolyticus]
MLIVVPVDPPREGLVLSALVDRTPLSASEAAALYEAAAIDVLRAAAASGGELLVNYRDAETLPDEYADGDPEAESRALVASALEDADDVRFERQVGSTRAARIGNTVTHLLDREGVKHVGILEPTVPLVARTELDGAAMSLRRHDVVLGPSTGGRTYFAGFAEPIDFTDAYDPPALSTLSDRTADAGLGLGFAPMLPTITTEPGLAATLAMLDARAQADRPGGAATAAVLEDLGVVVDSEGAIDRQ